MSSTRRTNTSAPPLEDIPNNPQSKQSNSPLFTFMNGEQIICTNANEQAWSGTLHLWKGDNGITTPTTNVFGNFVGFNNESFAWLDLVYNYDQLAMQSLKMCPTHISIAYKNIIHHPTRAPKIDENPTILQQHQYHHFKNALLHQNIEPV